MENDTEMKDANSSIIKKRKAETDEKDEEQKEPKRAKTKQDMNCYCMQCHRERVDVVQFSTTCPHVMCLRCAIEYTNYQLVYCNYRQEANPNLWKLTIPKKQWQASVDENKSDIRGKRDCPICKQGHLTLNNLSWTIYPNWVYEAIRTHLNEKQSQPPKYEPMRPPQERYEKSSWETLTVETKAKLQEQYETSEKSRKQYWNKEEKEGGDGGGGGGGENRYSCIWNCGVTKTDMSAILSHSWYCGHQTFTCPLPGCGMTIKLGSGGKDRITQINTSWREHIKTSCKYQVICKMCKTLEAIPLPQWTAHQVIHEKFKRMSDVLSKLEECLKTIQQRPGTLLKSHFIDDDIKDINNIDHNVKEIEKVMDQLISLGIPPYKNGSIIAAKYQDAWYEARVVSVDDQIVKIQYIDDGMSGTFPVTSNCLAYWRIQKVSVGQTIWLKDNLNPNKESWTVYSLDVKTSHPNLINDHDRIIVLGHDPNTCSCIDNACIIENEDKSKRMFVKSDQYRIIPNPNVQLWHPSPPRSKSSSSSSSSDSEDDDDIVKTNEGVGHLHDL